MKTAVFTSYAPLAEPVLRLFPLDGLARDGFPVEYWDLSPLFGAAAGTASLPRPFVRRFAAWEELEAALRMPAAAESLITLAAPFEPRFFRLHRLLSASPARLGTLITGVLPMPPASPLSRLRDDPGLLADPAKLAHFLLKRGAYAARRLGAVRPFDVAFVTGSEASAQAGSALVVPINSADYDDWLAARDSDPRLVAGRYAVYLDQFAPGHPDFALLGIDRLIDPVRYYSLLDGFFKRLEREHDLEVVIAAHPKADYPDNPFAGRRIFHSSTRALVRGCEFALATISTSLGLAVLDRKPLVFFTTEEMMARYAPLRHDVAPFHFAKTLGRRCRILDRPAADDAAVAPVDAALYDDYKYRYLASRETEGRASLEIYRDFFAGQGLAPSSRA